MLLCDYCSVFVGKVKARFWKHLGMRKKIRHDGQTDETVAPLPCMRRIPQKYNDHITPVL